VRSWLRTGGSNTASGADTVGVRVAAGARDGGEAMAWRAEAWEGHEDLADDQDDGEVAEADDEDEDEEGERETEAV